MNDIKWPLIWKNIKLDIVKKQLILLELVFRFGLKHIVLKKALMRMTKLLSFKLWATKIVCGQINLDTFKMSKGLSIQEKIKIVKSLENVLTYNVAVKTNIKLFKINFNIVQYLFQLILSPLLNSWGKNSLKRVLKRLKTKWVSYKKVKNFYCLSYSVILINKIIFYNSVLNMFLIFSSHEQLLKELLMLSNFYKFTLKKFSNISILFLFFKLIFNQFESFIWKKSLIRTITSSFIINKIFFCNDALQIKNLVLKLGYPTFLKLDIISFCNSFNVLYTHNFFIHNFILTEISKLFKEKGIYFVLRKIKICVLKTHTFIFFLWIVKWDKNQSILRLSTNKVFSLKKKLKQFFLKNFSFCSYNLVVTLNSIFKYWYNIFKLNNFYNDFKYLDNYLFELCWKWALKKHRKWTSKVILKFYFRYKHKFLFFKHKFNGTRRFKSENLKLKKKCIYIIRFQSLTLLN